MMYSKGKSNVVSAKDEVFESGGGSYIYFYPEDIERMETMKVEEQIEYKAWLIGIGRYIE